MQHLSLTHRISRNIYILSAREAFIALIPYLILASMMALGSAVVSNFADSSAFMPTLISKISISIYSLFPIVALISLSYFIAKNTQVERIASVVLALACFTVLERHSLIESFELKYGGQFSAFPAAIILPFLVVILLGWFQRNDRCQLLRSSIISKHLNQYINLIIPYALIFFLLTGLGLVAMSIAREAIAPLSDSLNESAAYTQTLVRICMTHILWFLGIHGDSTYSLLVQSDYLLIEVAPNFNFGQLINSFVLMGGSGAGCSLIIAVLLMSKDKHTRSISKLSVPFAIFNINEILIFGLPVVFNPCLLVPFILVPVVVFGCTLLAASTGFITFVAHDLSWITPPILSGYLASDGDITTVLFQIAMIALGVLIYAPFVRLSHLYNDDVEVAANLADRLAISPMAPRFSSIPTPSKAPDAEAPQQGNRVANLVEEILTGDLLLHYQPVKHLSSNYCLELCCKVYLRRNNGKVMALDNLENLRHQTVMGVIYMWQLNQLKDDFNHWQTHKYQPKVHFPVTQTALENSQVMDALLNAYSSKTEYLCIQLDESLLRSTDGDVLASIQRLVDADFELSLVNFGSESVHFDSLLKQNVKRVEIGLESLPSTDERQQLVLLKQLCVLYKNIGLQLGFSDVDNRRVMTLCRDCDADYALGAYVSPSLSATEAYRFCSRQHEQHSTGE